MVVSTRENGVLSEVAARQRQAADPSASAWVSASAGSGKTKVLTDRVLRLLLAGTAPARILCLTFTRAAAAEMSNRLNEVLAGWAVESETRLAEDVMRLTGAAPDENGMRAARQLFARVLDVPGGLRIQNFHAFCQALLARFPLEAGVAPHFRIMDDRTAGEMLAEARAEAMIDSVNARALEVIARHKGDDDFAALMADLLAARGRLARAFAAHGRADGLAHAVRARLGLEPGTTEATVMAEFAENADDTLLRRAAAALAAGSKTDKERAAAIASWLADPGARVAGFDAYVRAYLTNDDEIRKTLATAAVLRAHPAIGESLGAEAARALRAVERRKSAVLAEATSALLALGEAVIVRYDARKAAHARLDFDDLIQAAERLLTGAGRAAWVLYKLDGGIDHVLVDEAQDTSPAQWRVVRALTGEFFAGEGARESAPAPARSIFAVGDPKQSIFSFQGADPDAFGMAREDFAARTAAAGAPMAEVPLAVSFRSTPAVLGAVDAVFAREAARAGVSAAPAQHAAHRAGAGGLVELWPAIGPEDAPESEAWAPPLAERRASPPKLRLAEQLAAQIHAWTSERSAPADAFLPARGRRLRPGDIMVLVRRRDAFVAALVRALKTRGVPVAGVDRMVLTEQLAVMDLVALGEILLLPEDDLTLAAVLKSPLIGLDEDALFRLAHGRPGTLWDALRAGERDPEFARAHAFLAHLRARADFVRPYELYAEVLNGGGRKNLVARLGPDANDPIDEFMALALAHEREGTPSLQAFLHWLKAAETEVKRELEQATGAVRVMTVHGSKGLQAPVVILPDTTGVPTKDDAILWDGDVPLWAPAKRWRVGAADAALARARARRDDEHRRLLYVAMTRAEDRLYVTGAFGPKGIAPGAWYEHVKAGLADVAVPVAFDFQSMSGVAGPGLRLANAQAEDVPEEAPFLPFPEASVPAWFHRPPPPEPSPSRPLAPSRPSSEPAVLSPLADDGGARFRRGRLIHRLLQVLPEMAPAARAAAAQRLLAREAKELDAAARAVLAEEAMAVLSASALVQAFGPNSRAEVPLIGRVGAQVVVGQVDRLAVDDETVTILDYKTNRPPPARAEETPPVYLAQMALYRALVRSIYPGRAVNAVLVWTDGCRVMAVPEALLDAARPPS